MNPKMFHQIESQPKRHRILFDGHEIFSSDVLLEALTHYNKARQQFRTGSIEFKSACTHEGEKQ